MSDLVPTIDLGPFRHGDAAARAAHDVLYHTGDWHLGRQLDPLWLYCTRRHRSTAAYALSIPKKNLGKTRSRATALAALLRGAAQWQSSTLRASRPTSCTRPSTSSATARTRSSSCAARGFVTHQELGLVYKGIRGDLQEMDSKFSLEFVGVKKDISKLDEKFTKEFSSVRDEIRLSREESHRELIEVKNESLTICCFLPSSFI